jgi:hypothetical protein
MSAGGTESEGFPPEETGTALAGMLSSVAEGALGATGAAGPGVVDPRDGQEAQGASQGRAEAGRLWCDTFDADLLAVVPGAAEALAPAGDIELRTYSRLTNGKINCPSSWNTDQGHLSFFWTAPQFRPDACWSTDAPEAGCSFLEAVRDEWVHLAAISVNGHLVWRPSWRHMSALMYDLRGWTVLAEDEREAVRRDVLRSLERAAKRLIAVTGTAGNARVVYCRGCQQAWHDSGGPALAHGAVPGFGEPGECRCTCADDTDPLYEAWVVDPDPDDIPDGAWA